MVGWMQNSISPIKFTFNPTIVPYEGSFDIDKFGAPSCCEELLNRIIDYAEWFFKK
jgi:hypothetical protein